MAAFAADQRVDDQPPQILRAGIERQALRAARHSDGIGTHTTTLPASLRSTIVRALSSCLCKIADRSPRTARQLPARPPFWQKFIEQVSLSSALRIRVSRRAIARQKSCRREIHRTLHRENAFSVQLSNSCPDADTKSLCQFSRVVPAEILEIEEHHATVSLYQRIMKSEIRRTEAAQRPIDGFVKSKAGPRIDFTGARNARLERTARTLLRGTPSVVGEPALATFSAASRASTCWTIDCALKHASDASGIEAASVAPTSRCSARDEVGGGIDCRDARLPGAPVIHS